MSKGRKAEARGVRRWDREVAAGGDLDEIRDWVIWGVGDPSAPGLQNAGDGGDLAWMLAEERDPKWAEDDTRERWVLIVHADEDVVDELVLDNDDVLGYAPYPAQRERTG